MDSTSNLSFLEGTTIDGFHGMNSAYFLGLMADGTPTNQITAPAIATSQGEP